MAREHARRRESEQPMTRLESPQKLEQLMGAPRHAVHHLGRAVAAELRVYILHSQECLDAGGDLRDCEYSEALDLGIEPAVWNGHEDVTVVLSIDPEHFDLTPAFHYEDPYTHAIAIARAAATRSLQFNNEDDLQLGVADALADVDITATREVRLSDGVSRIDLLAGTVGVEVKIASSGPTVLRQLARYAECPEIDALVLVTTRAAHSYMPLTLNGKPLIVCSLIGGGL